MPSFKFQTRLTIVYLALFLAVQSIIIVAFYSSLDENVGDQVQDQLSSAARVFESIVDERVEKLTDLVQVVSQDFGFKEAILSEDIPTVKSALSNFGNRVDADFSMVYDIDGEIVTYAGRQGKRLTEASFLSAELKELAEAASTASSIMEAEGRLYEVVLAPVYAPDLQAWIALGIELDEVEALEIKELSVEGLEIAFLYKENDRYKLAASSSDEGALAQFLDTGILNSMGAVFRAPYLGDDYMFWLMELQGSATQGNEVSTLLYYSIDKEIRSYADFAITLLGILAIGLVFLFGGSMVISRGVTKPLRELASATNRIAQGEFHEVAAPTKDDEISDLTKSFNHMVEAVRERQDRIRFQAFHDPETGLPNRNNFEKDLIETVEKKKQFALVIAEVQQLLELRTVLNHDHVNDLLSGIGERLQQVSNAKVARLSTESFAFILEDAAGAEVVASLAINSFMTPFEIADVAVDASIKMGLAKFPDDGKDAMHLMQHANSALDQGRVSPKGYAWYVQDTGTSYAQNLSLMSDLREALNTGEVSFAYQPKLDLAEGKITSVEALVRWNSKTRGFVPPDDFIPFAERTGDVRHVSEWGLREAISQCAKWHAMGHNISIAVNLSTSDLMNLNLPGQILLLLREYKVPPENLKLEVTESAVMHDMSRALEVLNMLSAMGLTLSIDDYGTGYSSLSYLKKLPVSEIKIDKSFVLKLAENEEDRILVRSTIELGHNLGLKVTAEGVEDQQSVDMLSEYGCDTLQGYFISRPLPARDLESFLNEYKFK
ncbi:MULTISPECIES: bifunctional diguanylate cyclase/phosphodiesterase [Kordiimonas]|uniref:bifunctional diguanylate cyclase/phosphodiesterase n=1 Tax=Kordiimonas TaxID=288021 RepID=UPI001FF35018|nr:MULTISPECIES: EAL domain-containing protein [Kordiimonas]MCK0070587.1 EAL domain-containing protein [Kordiimonas laminariae]UTW57725.1 EAL domain-containing protein [Kordiimonas sp. SCSIO 12603]